MWFLDVFKVGLMLVVHSGLFIVLQKRFCLLPLWRFASGGRPDGLLLFQLGRGL
jgi:hypothetical protein